MALSDSLNTRLSKLLLTQFGVDVHLPQHQKMLAADVRRMSDFYVEQPFGQTPWHADWCQRAQLAYYFPLNATRLSQVIKEGQRLGFFEGRESYFDFGAGLGAFAAAFASCFPDLQPEFTEVEISNDARTLRQALASFPVNSLRELPAFRRQTPPADILVCSYSLTELPEAAPFLQHFPKLFLVEPSTREDSRRLLALRAQLIEQGYYIWAPCTHQQACPLLTHSEQDWCHDRLHFEMPAWMQAMEQHLPFRNRTLTFSYLLAAREPGPELQSWTRLTGDARPEKGKTRQMFCRGPEREFLAWMDRHGEAPLSPRGELARVPEGIQKSNELRVQGPLQFFNSTLSKA